MTNAHDRRTLEERLEWIANWSEPDIDLADAGTAREALHALLERAEAIQILETRIAVLEYQCERQAEKLRAWQEWLQRVNADPDNLEYLNGSAWDDAAELASGQ